MELIQELLPDPLNNRVVKSLRPPPHKPLQSKVLFKGTHEVNWKYLMQFLKHEGRLMQSDFLRLIAMVKQIVKNEPNLVRMNDPVTIVGDIHGQYYDLIRLLEIGGNPEGTKYLFLGDYVDRGSFSIEVLQLLFSLKISYPNTVVLLRGNHQCRQMTSFFNFRTQCLHKFNQQIYTELMTLFDLLPVAAIVNNRFFCTHGGLSPELEDVEEIDRINRVRQIPKSGLLCDLMWSDPIEDDSGQLGTLAKKNDLRGCSYLFGFQLAQKFLKKNNLLSVVRAHEAQNEGYRFYKWSHPQDFPTVVTIFSAPNYCDVYNNKGAIITLQRGQFDVKQYTYSQHPYFLPNFMDVFTWSLPFVTQKISHMFVHLLKLDKESVSGDQDIDEATKVLQEIYAIQHQQKMFNEHLIHLCGRLPDDKLIKSGVAIASQDQDTDKEAIFDTNKYVDQENQKRPDL